MNEFLNDNWKDAYNSLSAPIVEGIVQAVFSVINEASSVVPFEEAFPESLPWADLSSPFQKWVYENASTRLRRLNTSIDKFHLKLIHTYSIKNFDRLCIFVYS